MKINLQSETFVVRVLAHKPLAIPSTKSTAINPRRVISKCYSDRSLSCLNPDVQKYIRQRFILRSTKLKQRKSVSC